MPAVSALKSILWRRPAELDLDPVVHQAFRVQPLGAAGLFQQMDQALLDHPGADSRAHIVGAAPLEDDIVDTLTVQELAQQQARRSAADDPDLCPHGLPSLSPAPRAGLVMKVSLVAVVQATERRLSRFPLASRRGSVQAL